MSSDFEFSVRWSSSSFTLEESAKAITVRGVAVPANVTSKNNRHYTAIALAAGASSFIGKPFTENHNMKLVGGAVEDMFYDEETDQMRYKAKITRDPYLTQLRNRTLEIKGVSIEADYIFNKCRDCGKKLYSAKEFKSHMYDEHFKQVSVEEPHGLKGKALSFVTGVEQPGVDNTTFEVAEKAPHDLQFLFNTIIEVEQEKEKMMKQTGSKIDVPYPIKATPQIDPIKETVSTIQSEPPKTEPTITAPTTPIQESLKLIEKVQLKEESGMSFDQCIADGGSEEECARICKETRIRNQNNKAIQETLNALIESANRPLPKDDLSWSDRIDSMQKAIENRLTSVASDIVSVTNKWNSEVTKLTEAINNIPKDEWKQPLAEALAAIKPYDDKALKEMVAAIPAPYNDATIKETIAKIPVYDDKPLLLILDNIKEQLVELPKIKESVAAQRKDFETVLAVADKNIVETRKSLEEQTKLHAKEIADMQAKLKETEDKKLKETQDLTVRLDNVEDKVKPAFKGHAKETVKSDAGKGQVNTFVPYGN